MRRSPFKGMKMKKGNVVRLVTGATFDTVWWKNANAKKPKERSCTMKAWNRWVDGGPDGPRAVEVT